MTDTTTDPADLLKESADDSDRKPVPTINEWIPVVAALVSPSTAASYGSCWKKAEAAWNGRRMDTITASEIKIQAEIVRRTALVRRNSRGGRNAAENFIAAVRCLSKHLVNDQRIDDRHNPALRVAKPRRNPSTAAAWPTTDSSSSPTSWPAPATTRNSTRSSAVCMSRPPAAAAAHWPYVPATSMRSSACSCCGRTAKPNAHNPSRPH